MVGKSELTLEMAVHLPSKNRSASRVRIEVERLAVRYGGAALESERWLEAG